MRDQKRKVTKQWVRMGKRPMIGWQSSSEGTFSMPFNPGVVLREQGIRRQPSLMLHAGLNWEAVEVPELRCGRCKRSLPVNESFNVRVFVYIKFPREIHFWKLKDLRRSQLVFYFIFTSS